jgi:hypothetical protein
LISQLQKEVTQLERIKHDVSCSLPLSSFTTFIPRALNADYFLL